MFYNRYFFQKEGEEKGGYYQDNCFQQVGSYIKAGKKQSHIGNQHPAEYPVQVIDTERPACYCGNGGIYGPVSYFQAAADEENACGKKNHRKVAVALDKKDAVPGRIFAGVPFYAPHTQKSCSGQKKSEKTLCGKAVFKGARCVEPGAEQEKAEHIRIGAEGIEYFQSFQGIYADQALGAECIQKHLQAGQAVGHQNAESGKKEYDFSSCLMIPGDAEQGEYKINRQQGFNKPQMACSDAVQAAKGEKIGKNLVPAKAQRRNLAERSDGKEIDKPPGNKYNINQDCFPDVFFQLQRPGKKQRPVYHKKHGDARPAGYHEDIGGHRLRKQDEMAENHQEN